VNNTERFVGEILEGSICSICLEAPAVAFDGYWNGDPKKNAIFTCSDCIHFLANLIAKAVTASSPGDYREPLEDVIYRIRREALCAHAAPTKAEIENAFTDWKKLNGLIEEDGSKSIVREFPRDVPTAVAARGHD
jgi:hypothetical protein